jgi:CRISPR system Cascade subunit CasD
MAIFTITLAAPLMALQGPRIDNRPQAVPIPTRAMITGMIGAALGIGRDEPWTLQAIQDGMRIAVVVHQRGTDMIDYQTADLAKPYLRGPMWTGGLGVLHREGGDVEGTRQQRRPYRCDARMTVLVHLAAGAPFGAEAILAALRRPAYPIGIGRQSCPPAEPLAGALLDAMTLEDAIAQVPPGEAFLPAEATTIGWGDLLLSVPGLRNWATRQHGGAETFVQRAARACS